MSIQLIQKYYAEIDRIIRYGRSQIESSLRKPFQDLWEGYARGRNLVLVAEIEMESKKGTRIRPDGVLKDALRQDWGFWESKDEKGDIRYSATRLIPRKDKGGIEIDSQTTLRGVPAEAWEYRLGTYSTLGWILERYKENKPKDPTIAESLNTYRFMEYKEQVIELLMKVCMVSVETMKSLKEMTE